MSDPSGYALSLSPAAKATGDLHTIKPTEVDVNATYGFTFVRQRWFAAAGSLVQGSLMSAAGIYLLTQMHSTPRLAVQIAIVGALLTLGGLVFAVRAVADLVSRLTIDRTGIRGRFGLASVNLTWPEVEKWRVNDHGSKTADLFGAEFWTAGALAPKTIPAGYLDKPNLHLVRHLLDAFAMGKQQD